MLGKYEIDKRMVNFMMESGSARITDPCYDKQIWCAGTLDNVLIGKWNAAIIYSNEKSWGKRVAQLIAIHENHSKHGIMSEYFSPYIGEKWKLTDIDVGVDSAQAGIFDFEKYDPTDKFYDLVCKATDNQFDSVMNFGVVSRTGFGDGSYDCYTITENNKIIAIKLVYIDDRDYEEFREEE